MSFPTSFPGRVLGKVALVTGAASGIGAAVAKTLAVQGAKVYFADVADAGARAAAVTKAGGQAESVRLDVSSEAQWADVMARIKDESKRLDVVVNNAGISGPAGGVEDITLAEWEKLISINLTGVFLGTRAAVGLMKNNHPKSDGGASIINMSSIEGFIGDPRLPAYNASKGAVRIFTKSVALDLAKRGYGIRANTVHPAYVPTSWRACVSQARV